jgi:hypothetical protein
MQKNNKNELSNILLKLSEVCKHCESLNVSESTKMALLTAISKCMGTIEKIYKQEEEPVAALSNTEIEELRELLADRKEHKRRRDVERHRRMGWD